MKPSKRSVVATLVVATTVMAGGSGPAADARAVDQSYPVPGDGVYEIQGHGWGHGHGMSQYGARGAARAGLTWKQILEFYYPGTRLASAADEIRVLISADTSADVVVSPTSGLTLRDRTSGATTVLPAIAGVTRWRLNPDGGGNAVGYNDGTWHRWRTIAGDGEFFATGKAVTLWTPAGARAYRGALRASAPSKGSSARDTVNVLSIDDYLKGVVPAEMPASWETEAVRAQAVAARTYAAWSRAGRASSSWQICDTTSCQVYTGAGSEDSRANAAITATAGRILTHDAKPAFTQFSSSSGGWTAAGSVPYLVSQADPYESGSGNPYTDWTVRLSAAGIERAYPAVGTLRQIRVTSREGGGDWQGRVWSLTLDGTSRDLVVSGDSFRSRFGLRSTYFTFAQSAARSAILARWTTIGGPSSPVGEQQGPERAIPGGVAQDFASGSIYWSRRYGAWELYGPIHRLYQALKESAHPLGVPRRSVQPRMDNGARALFAGGVAFHHPTHGTVPLTGAIATKYLEIHGIRSVLGWPVRGNVATRRGERADFEHGSIRWNTTTGAVRIVTP